MTTIEKANSIVNLLIKKGSIGQLTCLVVDEMHMMGGASVGENCDGMQICPSTVPHILSLCPTDSQRGYLLELLVSKLQYMQRTSSLAPEAATAAAAGAIQQPIQQPPPLRLDLQVVAMSATLPNLEEVRLSANGDGQHVPCR